jgi:hypothetical protein
VSILARQADGHIGPEVPQDADWCVRHLVTVAERVSSSLDVTSDDRQALREAACLAWAMGAGWRWEVR